MVTIFRSDGFRFVIFQNDHEPAHVHVFGDGEMKINLAGQNGQVELVWADGIKRSDVRRAMKIVIEQQSCFLQRWHDIHG